MALKKQDLMDMFTFNTMTLKPENKQKVISEILPHTGRGGVSAARDYIQANCIIAEYKKAIVAKMASTGVKINPDDVSLETITCKQDLLKALHPATRFRLKMYTPCLASRYDELNTKEQDNLFTNRDVVFTQKMNGCRGILIVYKGQLFIYSRNYSDVDCSLINYAQNINQPINEDMDDIYAIDVEVLFEPGADISKDLEKLGLSTDSPLEAMVALLHTYPHEARKIQDKFQSTFNKPLVAFRLITPLYIEGKNYLIRKLGEGKVIYNHAVELGQSMGLNVLPIKMCTGTREEKEIFLNTILNDGGEGVVCHFNNGYYCTSDNRSKTSFVKIKRSIKSTQGLGDSFDAFVTGFLPGKPGTANEHIIGAFEFSIYINDNGKIRKHHIASVPNITRAERQLATWNNADGLFPISYIGSDGQTYYMSLNPEFNELVGELNGQALSAKSIRIEHPSLVMWRTERDPNSCVYTQEFINSQTTKSFRNNGGISYSK